MVSSQDPPPLKWSKHSLQWHPHSAALGNAHSFVSRGGRQGVAAATALHIAGTWRGNPPLCQLLWQQPHCFHHRCHGRCHCSCHLRCRCHHHCHCHCRLRRPLPLPSLSVIAVAVAIGHCRHRLHCRCCCHCCHHRPWWFLSPLSIAVAVAVGHYSRRCCQPMPLPLPLPSAIAIAVAITIAIAIALSVGHRNCHRICKRHLPGKGGGPHWRVVALAWQQLYSNNLSK